MRLGAIAVVLMLGAGTASAQSLGEIARRERERRATLEQHSPVLTKEDFQRRKILEPARETAAQPVNAVSEPVVETPATTTSTTVQVSLGEYARQLREQRAARQKQQEIVRVAATAPVAPAVSTPISEVAPAMDSVRVHDTAGRPVSLGEVARQLRHERQTRESAPQIAVKVDPALPRVSLGEYARGLQIARKAKRLEIIEPVGDVSATVVGVVGVQRGDTLWKLSAFYLGRGDLWTTLWRANPHLANPNLIHPGQLLRLPEATQLARHGPPGPGKIGLTAFSARVSTQFDLPPPGGTLPTVGGCVYNPSPCDLSVALREP